MSGQIAIVVNQIIVFAILMLIGFAAVKGKVITKDGLNTLSRFIVKIILPALIFSIIAGSGVTVGDFLSSGRFAVGVAVCYTILIVAGIAMSRLCRLQGKTANIFIALAAFGNMGFMGIPLIQAIYKEPVAQVCISVYTIFDMALMWTFGVYLCSRHQEGSGSFRAAKNMINPTTVTLIIAILIVIFKLPIPGLLMNTITGIGGTCKYLTLIYLGGSLAFGSFTKALKSPSIFMLAVVKMLIIPITLNLLCGNFLPVIPKTILTIIVGLPANTTIAMIAKAYGSDDEYSTDVIFVTTLFSLIAIPVVSAVTSSI